MIIMLDLDNKLRQYKHTLKIMPRIHFERALQNRGRKCVEPWSALWSCIGKLHPMRPRAPHILPEAGGSGTTRGGSCAETTRKKGNSIHIHEFRAVQYTFFVQTRSRLYERFNLSRLRPEAALCKRQDEQRQKRQGLETRLQRLRVGSDGYRNIFS